MGWGAPAASGRRTRRHGLAQPPQEVRQEVRCKLVAPRRGLLDQCEPPRDIFGHALAVEVQAAQVVLRTSMALRRSLLPQLDRPLVALRHSVALVEQGAQAGLRISVALYSRLRVELSRPLVAMRHAIAVAVAAAQLKQRLRVIQGSASHPLRGRRPDALGRGGGGRAPPALADPHNLARLPLRRRHLARRLVALPVRALALMRAVEHGAAAGEHLIRVVLLGGRTAHARAHVTDAVDGGGGRGRALE